MVDLAGKRRRKDVEINNLMRCCSVWVKEEDCFDVRVVCGPPRRNRMEREWQA